VFLEILAGLCQRRGERQIADPVPGSPNGAGQDPRCRQTRLAADQHLRRRADEAVDGVRPAPCVSRGQCRSQPSRIDLVVGESEQIAGQHDLVQRAQVDPTNGFRDRRLPFRTRQSSISEGDVSRRNRLLSRRQNQISVRIRTDAGQP
jgi:hypothetical protein